MNEQSFTERDLIELLEEQASGLSEGQRAAFERFRVRPWRATIVRIPATGPEPVFVVAQRGTRVLYFDEVEFGFNLSEIDGSGRIMQPGARQNELADVIDDWTAYARERE